MVRLMREEPTVKGTALLSTVELVRKRFGESGHARVLEALAPAERAVVEGPVLSSARIPHAALIAYMTAADSILGDGSFAFCEEAGRYSAYDSLSRIFKLLLKLTSPLGMVKRAPGIWRHFYSEGELKILSAAQGHGVIRIEGFSNPSDAHCRRIQGFFFRVTEVTGGKNVAVRHTRCQAHGAPACEYTVRWDQG